MQEAIRIGQESIGVDSRTTFESRVRNPFFSGKFYRQFGVAIYLNAWLLRKGGSGKKCESE